MALNTSKCNHLTLLRFKGLSVGYFIFYLPQLAQVRRGNISVLSVCPVLALTSESRYLELHFRCAGSLHI